MTTRAHAHYIVTEYGVVQLWGKSVGERMKALAAIAHPGKVKRFVCELIVPAYRPWLEYAIQKRYWLNPEEFAKMPNLLSPIEVKK